MSAPATDVAVEHRMVIAIGIMVGAVIIMGMIAESGPEAGHVMVLLMVILVTMQGLGHINPLATWVGANPLQGPNPTKGV